jgi:hypothetical protein
VASFYRTDQVKWTLVTSRTAVPRIEQAERTYNDLDTLKLEIFNARVWGGLHWRYSMLEGAQIGGQVAAHVTKRFFGRTKKRQAYP